MKNLFCIIPFLLFCCTALGQTASPEGYISWSSTRKLTADDFAERTSGQTAPSSAMFVMSYEVKAFDFFSKNFNKKVQNQFMKSSSWLNTKYDAAVSVRYQQTLFDLSEIYTRHFRKSLKENKKKFASNMKFVDELHAKAMADFAKRRTEYNQETAYGTDAGKQQEWEIRIQTELTDLNDFANE